MREREMVRDRQTDRQRKRERRGIVKVREKAKG